MIRSIGVHRPNHAQVVGTRCEMGKIIGKIHAALAMFYERPRRRHDSSTSLDQRITQAGQE